MKDETKLQHPKQIGLQPGNRALISPVYHTVKFTVDSLDELSLPDRFFYTRVSNPTTRELELQLAALQGCEDGLAVGSGCAALSVPLLSLLKSGDHVVHFIESYLPLRYLIQNLMGKFGVQSTMVSITDPDAIRKAIRPQTRMMIFESPTNPTTHIADLGFLVSLAKKNKITTVLDNTFAGLFSHGSCGVDLFVHSLTKFVSGHGDVMGGVILGSKKLLNQMRPDYIDIGAMLDPGVAAQISRGLKTYTVRRERQCATALEVAKWLEANPSVARVWYPGLPSHPGYELANKQMVDSGAIIAFDLAAIPMADFLGRLKLFTLAGSLGSCESLVAPVKPFYGRDLSSELLKVAKISDSSVRLSIGLEAAEDLIADLERALAR